MGTVGIPSVFSAVIIQDDSELPAHSLMPPKDIKDT